MQVSRDEQKIDELLSRSVDTIYPSKEDLKKKLLSGEQLRVYAGWDATGKGVHLGHAINYLMLKRFHELGHKIIVLVGDFTAMIGDPTDKSSARVRLTKEEVQENLSVFKEQVKTILDLETTDNPIEFRFNSEWLSGLTFEDVVDLAANFTVQQMIERDTFAKRIDENKPLYVHEFFYPLMQGFDSVALEVDVEIGGTDQTFNMLAGRTLVKRYLNKEKFVMTHPLLENPETGEILMSKSAGTGVNVSDTPQDMFGKIMALPDAGILLVFEHCTELPLSQIEEIKEELEGGANPKEVKERLGVEIVSMYHGREAAEAACEGFSKAFSGGEMLADAEVIEVSRGEALAEVLVSRGVVASKTEFRRLVDAGAIKMMPDQTSIISYDYILEIPLDLKVGKRRFIKIEVK